MEGSSNKQRAVRVSGTVTSYDAGKGYGFVARGGGPELFADQKAVQDDGPCILAIGDRVRYEVIEGSEGPYVSSVRAF
jgi:CspA family cold shock protein